MSAPGWTVTGSGCWTTCPCGGKAFAAILERQLVVGCGACGLVQPVEPEHVGLTARQLRCLLRPDAGSYVDGEPVIPIGRRRHGPYHVRSSGNPSRQEAPGRTIALHPDQQDHPPRAPLDSETAA